MRTRMAPALVGIALVGTGCTSKHERTAVGASVLEWDHTKASRAGFAKGRVGSKTPRDYAVVIAPPAKGGPAELNLHVEYAPIDFEEDGKTHHQTSPVLIRVSVSKNSDWTIRGDCPDGPAYATLEGEAMLLDCHLALKYGPNFTFGTTLTLHGDTTLRTWGNSSDTKVVLREK